MDKKSEEVESKKLPKIEEFNCPITLEPFEEPVLAIDGHTYEKKAIKKWLKQGKTSPLTNEPLTNKFFYNWTFKKAMEEYREKIRPHMKQEKKLLDETKSELAKANSKLKKKAAKIKKLESTLKQTKDELNRTTALLIEAHKPTRHSKRIRDKDRFFKSASKNENDRTAEHPRKIRRRNY